MKVAEELRAKLVTQRAKTVTRVASELQISRPAFSNVVNGNADLSVELALTIQHTFGLDARRLLVAQLDEKLSAAKWRFENDQPIRNR